METAAIATILDILIRVVTVAPSLANAYQKIISALHQTGDLTTSEWEMRKAEYIDRMGSDAWKPDTPTE
jgi:hypothetical protein